MDEQGFRSYLKKYGKQEHVISGLIRQVRRFEDYLAGEPQAGLESARVQDLEAYADALEGVKSGSAKKYLRGLALYFKFTGQAELASFAGGMRSHAVALDRQGFKLRDFLGVDPQAVARLEAVGLRDAPHLLAAGSTPESRQQLAEKTGLPEETILELVKLSDLARIEGIKGIRARLYYDAGVDTLEKMAQWEPQALLEMAAEFVARTGFAGIAPLPKEVQYSVMKARQLPKIVQY